MLCKNVKANGFVLRQTPESDYSHFEGPWEELEQMVLENWGLILEHHSHQQNK